MFNENHGDDTGKCACGNCRCEGGMQGKMGMMMKMPKEFKLAMLEKKEKMLQAKLEFIGKMKEMIKNMPEAPK